MNSEMTTIFFLLDGIEKKKELIEEEKKTLSRLLKELKENYPEAAKKFQWDGKWFLIKKRGDLHFITNYEDVEPGSWKKKKVDA